MKVSKAAFLTTIVAVAMTTSASAAIIANGSIAFSDFVATYTGATLATATAITLSGSGGIVTAAAGTPFACPGTDCVVVGSATATTPTTFSVPLLPTYINFLTFGPALRYSFTPDTASTKSSITANDLTIFATGTFRDSLNGYTTNNASLEFDFTQTGGPGNAISGSGTFHTPASFSLGVPEPGTLLLLGGALMCVGLFRRKIA